MLCSCSRVLYIGIHSYKTNQVIAFWKIDHRVTHFYTKKMSLWGGIFPEGQFHLACFDFIKLRETSSQKFSNKENEFHETRIHTLNICWSRGHEHYRATNSIGWCVSLLNWLLFELSWRQKVGEQFLYYFGTFFFSQLIIYSYEKSSHIFSAASEKVHEAGTSDLYEFISTKWVYIIFHLGDTGTGSVVNTSRLVNLWRDQSQKKCFFFSFWAPLLLQLFAVGIRTKFCCIKITAWMAVCLYFVYS